MSEVPEHRSYVGPAERYDLVGAMQFSLLTAIGLREHHTLLDVGCGSLRGGRLFLAYLLPDRYFGIEPNMYLVEAGIDREVGRDVITLKRPTFSDVDDFSMTTFGRTFDFVLAQSILSHAGRAQVERCLQQASEVLEPRGVFAATYMPGPVDHTGDGWVYPDVVEYRTETLQAIGAGHGLEGTAIDWPHPNGQRWMLFTRQGAEGVPAHEPDGYVDLRDQLRRSQRDLERLANHPVVRAYDRARRAARKVVGPRRSG
jgi:SAM-dependent methyltransferase